MPEPLLGILPVIADKPMTFLMNHGFEPGGCSAMNAMGLNVSADDPPRIHRWLWHFVLAGTFLCVAGIRRSVRRTGERRFVRISDAFAPPADKKSYLINPLSKNA